MRVGAARAREHATLIAHLVLGVVSYLPLLLTARGRLAADTRQAVYLDPGRFLHDALSMWDPSRDLGTVTHQNIVLVWPMGVWYRAAELLGVPLWLAQRAWTGTILFVAGAGVLYLARTLRWDLAVPTRGERRGAATSTLQLGPAVAALAYAMGPYVIQYGTRTSVLLLPWAALPWLIGLTARALATKGWRHPALFALVVLSIAVNATALAMALLGPALWVVWAVWGTREVTVGDALRTIGRIVAVGIPTSLWWVVALLIEGRFGLPLLDFTETIDQVASTSAATEVLRGLGYWVPYLQQHDYPEVTGAAFYLQRLPVLALQLGVVGLAVVGTSLTRWRHRTVFAAMVVVGVVIGIGAYPPGDPSPLSSLFHDLARSGGVGLALRSTTRAAPLALLGLAVLLGGFVDALVRRAARVGRALALGLAVLAVGLAPSVAGRQLVDPLYSRPDELPEHWVDALAAADAQAGNGRLLELPGTRYAAYRWGNTYEPITAGYARTPTAWREQIPYGGAGSAELLVSLDDRLQEGRLEAGALAPVARLMGASLLLVRNDLAYERYDTIAPDRVWSLVSGQAPGLGPPQGFGPVGVNEPDPTHQRDDQPVPADPTATYPAVALVPVVDAPGLVTTAPLASTVLLDGSGDGLIDAAASGLVDGRAPVLYAGTTADHPELLEQVLDARARIVLTDTNRRRVERWRSIKNTRGITLRADEDPADSAGQYGGEAALDALPADSAWQTVAAPRGATVSATRYGNPLWFEAGVRPAAALDGDPATAWRVGPTIGGVGDRLTVELDEPLAADHLTLTATDEATQLTEVRLRFDGGPALSVGLDASSRQPAGQLVTFPARTFRRLEVELAATQPAAPGVPDEPVGIVELGLTTPDGRPVRTDEVVRLPTALVDQLGAASLQQPLAVVLTRLGGDTTDPFLFQEERSLVRALALPTERTFTAVGRASGAAGTPAGGPAPGCRDDLVTIDGAPVPVELRAAADGALDIVGCAPIPLAVGDHLVRSTPGADVHVDRLVLSSEAGGGPTPVDASGQLTLPPGPGAASPDWRQPSLSSVELDPPASEGPMWVVLGQSLNDGWQARTSAGDDLSDPVLVNGFANGFLVADGFPADTTVTLTWGPQRVMAASLWLAALGIALALVLVVRGRPWPHLEEVAEVGLTPVLDAPWAARPVLSWLRVLVAAAGLGAVSAAVIGPPWGLAAAVVVVVAGRWSRGHALLLGGAVAALGAALGTVVVDRAGHRDVRAYDFFTSLHEPHRLALLGLTLLAGDLLLSRARPRREALDPLDSVAGWWRRATHRWEAPPHPSQASRRVVRRRFTAATAAGLAPAAVLFTWLLTAGRWDLFAPRPTSDFYDAQAHALLGGHLDIPRSVLGIEAFVVDGRAYMYQGPFPALLRLPVAALTDGLDGRLAGLSMLLAFVAAGAAVGAIVWQLRSLVRGDEPLGRWEASLVALFAFSATAGSVLLFLGSQVSVYHESAAWGIALGLAALASLLRHLVEPWRWSLPLTSLLAAGALWSRASIGIGVVAALGLVAVGHAATWWRTRRGRPTWGLVESLRGRHVTSGRALLGAVAACLLPVVAYVAVNEAKFGTAASVPWDRQVFSQVSSPRQEFLERNEGSFFGLRFVPSTAAAYLRPDAFSIQDRFPYVGFREDGIGDRQRGGVLFDKVDATASLPVSFPLLGLLSLLGLAAVARGLRRAVPLRPLIGPLLGAAASAATIFVFGFIAQRYLSDVLPVLVVAGGAGLVVLVRLLRPARRSVRMGALAAVAAVALGGVGVTVAQALWYQRVYASPGREADTSRFYETRADLPRLPVGHAPVIRRGDALPARGPAGELFVVGDCAGVYVSDGGVVDELTKTSFKPVVRTPAVGAHDLDTSLDAVPAGRPAPLLVAGTAEAPHILSVERDGPDHVRFRYRGGDLDGAGPRVAIGPGRQHLEVAADPGTGLISVLVDGEVAFEGLYLTGEVPTLGVNDLDGSTSRTFPGTLAERPADGSLCRSLLGSAGPGGD